MRLPVQPLSASLLFCYFIVESHATLGTSTTIDVAPTLSTAAPIVDRSFISYSMELSAVTGFSGNQFITNLFNVWSNKTGGRPGLRLGGTGMDKSYLDPNQTQAMKTVTGGTLTQYYFGPSFLTTIANYFKDMEITFGLNLGNITGNWSNTVDFAIAVKINVPQVNLFEIGNEVDLFVQNNLRQEPWNNSLYANQWSQVATTITSKIAPAEIRFQGAAYSGPSNKDFNLEALLKTGVNNTFYKIPTYSEHFYSQSFCSGRAATRIDNLVNHTIITTQLQKFPPEISAAQRDGAQFVFGEVNTVSCGGAPGISDTFGSALWLVDWGLLSASMGVQRIYIHSTLNTDYSMLIPKAFQGFLPGLRPMAYGMYFLAEALALPTPGSDTRFMISKISLPDNPADISIYGLYSNRVQQPPPFSYSSVTTQTISTTSTSIRTFDPYYSSLEIRVYNSTQDISSHIAN
ncbi:hypothetical protein ABW20_dc0109203 [Dactylellina cionopaga]|nr:hypothetical protein ABW20_dc0109203 [Dactylellina cionopaga]